MGISTFIKGSEILKRSEEIQNNTEKLIKEFKEDVRKLSLDKTSETQYRKLLEKLKSLSYEHAQEEIECFIRSISVDCSTYEQLEEFSRVYDKWTGESTYISVSCSSLKF